MAERDAVTKQPKKELFPGGQTVSDGGNAYFGHPLGSNSDRAGTFGARCVIVTHDAADAETGIIQNEAFH